MLIREDNAAPLDSQTQLAPQDATQSLGRVRRLLPWLHAANIVLSLVGFVFAYQKDLIFAALAPRPWVAIALNDLSIGALAAMPWVAIVLVARFQPLLRFFASRNDTTPNLSPFWSLLLIFPALVLGLRALREVHTLDWRGPLILTLLGALILAAAVVRVDPTLRRREQGWGKGLRAMLFIGCAYGFGAGLELNTVADASPAKIYRTTVLGMHVHRGRATTYDLTLDRWGPMNHIRRIDVPAFRYRITRPGTTICVRLRSGAFEIPWYEISSCPETTAPPTAPLADRKLSL